MPLYVYTCEAGHVSEDFRPVNARHETSPCTADVADGTDTCGRPTRLTPAPFVGQVVGGTPVHYPNL